VKVRISDPAKRQAREIDRWWRANRQAAPTLFAEELAEARRLLTKTPDLGSPYVERRGVLVRRVLLRKSQNHVYYEIDRVNGIVIILAVWGAPKGRGPTL
jgi:plasmid stabilization system protein ParE